MRVLAIILAVWFGLSSLLLAALVLRGRRRPLIHPVESKEAPGGLQGPRPLP